MLFGSLEVGARASFGVDDWTLEEPSLERLSAAPRARIEELRQRLWQLMEEAGSPPVDTAEVCGLLGQYYLAFDYLSAAASAFSLASALDSERFDWHYYMGVALEGRGDFEAAIEAFAAAREKRQGDGPTLIRLGNAALELQQIDTAEDAFTRLLEAEPESAAGLFGLARIAALRRRDEQAVALFERVLELEPTAAAVHYPLAQAYRRLGDLERAREELAKRGSSPVPFADPLGDRVSRLITGGALQVVVDLAATDDFSDSDFLGFVLSQLGGVEGATEELTSYLSADSISGLEGVEALPAAEIRGRLFFALGGLLVREEKEEAAESAFRQAIELAPSLLDARLKLGNVLARAERFAAATDLYTAVLERDPENSEALLKRAAAAMEQSQYRDAAADLDHLLELRPDSSEGTIRSAVVSIELGDVRRGEELYRRALELDLAPRERASASFELATLLNGQGESDEALALYEAAISADPALTDPYFPLGNMLGQRHDYEGALAAYRQLLSLEPDHELARLGVATVLVLEGREREAVASLEEGLEVLPSSLGLTHTLARLLAAAKERAVRNGARAVELAAQAARAVPSLEHAETLAMALAEAGRFDEAAKLQGQLLEDAERRDAAAVKERLERHLALYEAGKSCCSP